MKVVSAAPLEMSLTGALGLAAAGWDGSCCSTVEELPAREISIWSPLTGNTM